MSDVKLDAKTTPVEIRAPKAARVLEVVWEDGVTTRHRHVHLRGFCPCAHCQGHQGPINWTALPTETLEEALELVSIEQVGSYAVQLGWGDGHRTGIYSFPYLRELGELTGLADEDAQGRMFGR